MSELTLEAMGYRPEEAAFARRIHDLTHSDAERAAAQRPIHQHSADGGWHLLEPTPWRYDPARFDRSHHP